MYDSTRIYEQITREVIADNTVYLGDLDEEGLRYASCVALAVDSKKVKEYLKERCDDIYVKVHGNMLVSRALAGDWEMLGRMMSGGDYIASLVDTALDVAVNMFDNKMLDTMLAATYVFPDIHQRALERAERASLQSKEEHTKQVIKNAEGVVEGETEQITLLSETVLLANEICDLIPPALIVNYSGNTVDKAIAFVREHVLND